MDVALAAAIGNALTALTSMLQDRGVIDMQQYAGVLEILGTVDADSRPEESQILRHWAATIKGVAEGIAEQSTPH